MAYTKYKGFTLLEIVLVIIIITIIAAGSAQLLVQGFRAYFSGQNFINAEWQGRVALERMVRDLRAVRSSADITSASSTAITFNDIDGQTITYQLSGSQLMCNTQNNNQPLAEGINSLNFAYYNSAGSNLGTSPVIASIRYIVITLNVTFGGTNSTVQIGVYPWNLN